MNLEWDLVEGAESYYVQRATERRGPYITVCPRLTATTFVDQGLDEGIPYYYVVVAANTSGSSPPSNEVGVLPPGMRPAAPTGLSVTSVDGSVFLDWEDSIESSVSAYHVFRSITRGGPYAPIRVFVSTSEHTDRDVVADTSYYYVVTALVIASEGGMVQSFPSNEAVADSTWQSQDIGSVAAEGLFVRWGSSVLIEGSGEAISGTSDEFRYVFRELHGDGEISGRVTSVWDPHQSTTVGFMIREALSSDSKNVLMGMTPQSGAIFQRRSLTGDVSEVLVRPPGLFPHYLRLRRSGDTFTADLSTDGESWSEAGSTTVPMIRRVFMGMAITSNKDGTLTSARFEGISQSGNTAPVDTDPPAAPFGLVGTAGDAFVDLDWSDNTEPDLDGYNVYRGTTVGGPYSLIASAIAISDYTDSSVDNGTTYYYVVTAADTASNESPFSEVTSATPIAAAGVDIVVEAEDAVLVGAKVFRNHPAIPVDFVYYVAASGESIEWTMSVPAARTYTLEFRYSVISGDRPLRVLVNGSFVSFLSFPSTGSWTRWSTATTTATLRAGSNTVRAVSVGLSGGLIDYLRVTH